MVMGVWLTWFILCTRSFHTLWSSHKGLAFSLIIEFGWLFCFCFLFWFCFVFCFINELLVERASQLTFAMFLMFRWAIWSVFYVNSRSRIGANLHYVHRGSTARFEFTSCMCFFLLIYILYLRYGFRCQGARKFRCLDFYFFDSKQSVYYIASESCKCSWCKIEWKFLTST